MSNFAATPLEKLVEKLGSPNPDIRRHLQFFETRRKTTDFNALKVAFDHTPNCVDPVQLNAMLAKHQDPTQPLYIDLYNRRNFTVANNLQETGYESGSTARFTVNKQGLLSVKITIDVANLKRWDAYTENLAEKWQMEYDYLVTEAWMNLLQALNGQVLTFLDSVKATNGGAGTRFANTGDFKVIPWEDSKTIYRKMRTEAKENRFGRSGRPTVLGSLVMAENLENISGFGPNNNENLQQQLDWFDPVSTDALAVPTPAEDESLLYLIDRGGIAAASWVYNFEVPEMYKMSNERWDTVELSGLVDGLPPIKIGYKDTLSKTDDFATYAIEESRINRKYQAMFWTNLVLLRAHSSVATESPVIAYIHKKEVPPNP